MRGHILGKTPKMQPLRLCIAEAEQPKGTLENLGAGKVEQCICCGELNVFNCYHPEVLA